MSFDAAGNGWAQRTVEVIPTRIARSALPTLRRFRIEGLLAEPMVFGGHRKPEGVVRPYELFERLLLAIEDVVLDEAVQERLARNEAPVDFDSFASVNGFDVDIYRSSPGRRARA